MIAIAILSCAAALVSAICVLFTVRYTRAMTDYMWQQLELLHYQLNAEGSNPLAKETAFKLITGRNPPSPKKKH